ncbi:MAG: ATP-binding cassette domain-containing protein [Synergistaceae bacterium]|nr:ATP-binding cassette domain-containing protein [Synergistaceae bacterium]
MSLVVDIEKRIGAFWLRAAFEMDEETVALLGASGHGKSMTLKCIAGIERPDRGGSCWTARSSSTRRRGSTCRHRPGAWGSSSRAGRCSHT